MKDVCLECFSCKLELEWEKYCYFTVDRKRKEHEFHIYDSCQYVSDVKLIDKLEGELIARSLIGKSLDDNI